MKEVSIKKIVQQFIKATNEFDVKATLALFADNAVIDDVSVCEKFKNISGVRKYLEEFFVGYHTVTKLVSVKVLNNLHAKAQVDFTGDFGHETGGYFKRLKDQTHHHQSWLPIYPFFSGSL